MKREVWTGPDGVVLLTYVGIASSFGISARSAKKVFAGWRSSKQVPVYGIGGRQWVRLPGVQLAIQPNQTHEHREHTMSTYATDRVSCCLADRLETFMDRSAFLEIAASAGDDGLSVSNNPEGIGSRNESARSPLKTTVTGNNPVLRHEASPISGPGAMFPMAFLPAASGVHAVRACIFLIASRWGRRGRTLRATEPNPPARKESHLE